MLAATGKHILELLGKTPGEPGIVTVEQIPEALRTLEQAVQEDDARRKQLQTLQQSAEGSDRARRRRCLHSWGPSACASVWRRWQTCCAAVLLKARM